MNNNVREVAFKLANEAKRRGIKIIFDCNFRPSLWEDVYKRQMKMIEEKLMPVALKISGQRHMQAVRQGVVATLPLTIVCLLYTSRCV